MNWRYLMAKNGNKSNSSPELPIVIHSSIKSKIHEFYKDKKQNHSLVALGLYLYFYDSARQQNNERVWLTDSFIRQGTGIGTAMLRSVKKDLASMGLIEVFHDRKEGGVFGKRYVKIMYIWQKEAIEKLFNQANQEVSKYKILKELFLGGDGPHAEIKSRDKVFFETKLKGKDVVLSANIFYFDEDEKLIARALVKGSEGTIDYTVPTDRVTDTLEHIASSYSYKLSAILRVCQL